LEYKLKKGVLDEKVKMANDKKIIARGKNNNEDELQKENH